MNAANMSATLIGRLTLSAIFALGLLSGCTASSRQMPTTSALALSKTLAAKPPQAFEPGLAPGGMMFTAQLYGNDVGVYRRMRLDLKYFETISNGVSGPQGMVATENGWLYVANGGHSNVLIYRTTNHGPKGPFGSLDDYGQLPVNVDVGPNRRLVAVSNGSTIYKGAGSVSVYLDRRAEPARILTFGSDPLEGMGIAIDRRGNCYWSFNDPASGGGSIVKFAHCAESASIVVSSIAKAGGIAFDKRGNLYYVDQTNGIYRCVRTSRCALFATGFGDPTNINFDRNSKNLWVADATGYIDAVSAKTGAIEYTVKAVGGATDPPFGIAPEPGS